MLYAVDLSRTLSVCCESFCMLSLIAVGGLGLFDFFFSSMENFVVADGSVWACSVLLFSLIFGAPMLSPLDHVGVSE